VLTVYQDHKDAYDTASYHYHETLFRFGQAFALNKQWLERHPNDLAALSDFAEKHFTTGRFTECDQRIGILLANPAIEPHVHIALRAIQIANALALDKTDAVPGNIDTLIASIANQAEEFKVNWSFKGVKYFIGHNEKLAPYRLWLMQFFEAVEEADRDAFLAALREVRVSLPAVVIQ
jgi:hypothetical protein